MGPITGLHHITVIAGDPQENVDFYAGVLGMRLVKKTINQDVPDTYHLFYADAVGHPGTDLTFFPWPDMDPGQQGVGLAVEVGLAVPPGSLGYWAERLRRLGVAATQPTTRFGERVLPFTDPHGLTLALMETADERQFAVWSDSPVPAEYQIRGLHAVRLAERSLAATAAFLTQAMGFEEIGREGEWHRFGPAGGGSGRIVDVRESPAERRGRWGPGIVHHVAWRVPDEVAELEAQAQVQQSGGRPTEVIDRFWFKSVYFKEPGGVLFEVATDGPGFTVDESPESLGEKLVLPPWYEPAREEIERRLPPLHAAGSRSRPGDGTFAGAVPPAP